MEWFDCSFPLRPPGGLEFEQTWCYGTMLYIQVKNEIFGEDWLKSFATEILDAKYKKTDVAEVMKGLTHLDAHQKQTCFECYRKAKRCLMKLLMFIHMKRLSKEDNRACRISTSHQLNKVKRCKQYLLLIITDILRKCSRYEFFTKLDNSMQYYTFELDSKSQDSCTIITPFGKYKYLRLLMGLKCSPDIA